MTLQGGEPLVHPEIVRLVSQTAAAGISCAVITNGWFLSRYVASLAAAGLCQLIVSLDSANLAAHERNRGLEGLEFGAAAAALFRRSVAQSLWALAEEAPKMRRLARRRKRAAAANHAALYRGWHSNERTRA